ncbi:MAG: MBL fold metallo-hydrolase [Candidatus Colwellbacteria bacterium]|nr:MBL fold metallo-hydrolase [Candidatus Colwellbacteria bacterium]
MIINWYGNGCYKVQASGFDIVVDPDSSQSGSRLKGNLILKTSSPFPIIEKENEIAGPGEYEISGAVVRGSVAPGSSREKIKTVYRVVADGIRLGFLGDISSDLDEKALDSLGEVDILFVPSNPHGAKLAKTVEPKIVVPGWGDPKKVALDMGAKTDAQEKLVVKKKDMDEVEGMSVVILKS